MYASRFIQWTEYKTSRTYLLCTLSYMTEIVVRQYILLSFWVKLYPNTNISFHYMCHIHLLTSSMKFYPSVPKISKI